jgi:hypothetical protein
MWEVVRVGHFCLIKVFPHKPFHSPPRSKRRNQKKTKRPRVLRHIYLKPSKASVLCEKSTASDRSTSSRRALSKFWTRITIHPHITILLLAKHEFARQVLYEDSGVASIKWSRLGFVSRVLVAKGGLHVADNSNELVTILSTSILASLRQSEV